MSEDKKKETRQPWKERRGDADFIPKPNLDKRKALLDKMRGGDEKKPDKTPGE